MARDSIYEASWEEAFRWQRPPRPDEPEVRDVAVDPFSLRQFSRLDIDRPLPIPSVSVDDRRAHASPARLNDGASVPGTAASSPRASIAGGLKAPAAEPAGLDIARPVAHSVPSGAPPGSKLSGDWETELADAGFDVAILSSERKASEPQRWASDVPLIAAADAEEYSFGYAKDGRGKQAAKHAGKAPFTCCMFVPGLGRRIKPPTSTTTAAVRSYSSGAFGKTAAVETDEPGTCSARPSTMSLAVSLERFDCGSPSTSSSSRGLGLGDGEAASSSSYFDLPLELILGCDDEESDLPVCAAFLFDSDGIRKSVLKRRLEAGTGMEPRRPSLGKVSTDASGRISSHHVRVSLKSRSPATSTSP
ncbi:hypothetical protein BAE44_0010321 [Dichanthelium oligosanthes]|uniref:Uncharacterized protein n=1 Tax=Dichanthelium oligosanthes TaxID=888268 RepID=A0A1E5VU72_9POAL|nr:hypothetical protein BAE44_0010321 [Dichanthelium oligosanthes]